MDLDDPIDSPYYDFTDAYDAYNKRSAAQNHEFVRDTSSIGHGHGSVVADLIVRAIRDTKAQPGAGAADVRIMPIRDTITDLRIDNNALIRGVFWAADHGADVINLSVKYGDLPRLNDPSDLHHGATLSQAIRYAESRGAVVVTASGNNSHNIDDPLRGVSYPAFADDSAYNGLGTSLTNVLVAAAVDSSGHLTRRSNWGQVHVDLGAYTNSEGLTSYAAGYTSGVAGVISALRPDWTPAQVIDRIKRTVQPVTQTVGNQPLTKWSTTNGVISPANALNGILNPGPRFDFGTASSPVASGFARVTAATTYAPSSGRRFGWSAGIIGDLERSRGTELTRDLNYTRDGTFTVELPNGTYIATMTLGDAGSYSHDRVAIFLGGSQSTPFRRLPGR